MTYRIPKIWLIKDDILYFLTDRLSRLCIEIMNKKTENKDYKVELKKAKILKKLIETYQILVK